MINRLLHTIKCTVTDLGRSIDCENALIHTSGNAYKVALSHNGHKHTMIFHDNFRNASTLKDYLYSLYLDAICYENARDVYDFAREYGYDDMSHARKVYRACERQSEALHRLFTEQEISLISEIE